MNWLHYEDDGSEVELDDTFDISDCFGFVYKITNIETGKIYIGKKSFFHNKKKKLTKKELAEQPITRGRKITTKVEQVDSGWRDYYGSSKELIADIKLLGKDKFHRIILDFCETKKQLTYSEIYNQMIYRVLFIDSYNDNILGKFYRKDFVSPE
jgi:uncharacterized protein YnzC (UPF0291/DUF896 family)